MPKKASTTSPSQWRYGPAAALACCVWAGAGAIVGAFSPLLYPQYRNLSEAMFLGALGGLLGGIAWAIHMIRRSLRRKTPGGAAGAGAWLGLGVLAFYMLLLQVGVVILLDTDPWLALPRAAVAVGLYAAPAGFLLGLILGWMWAAIDAVRAETRSRQTGDGAQTTAVAPPAPAAGPPPSPRSRYRSLLTPPEPSAFDHHPELDFQEDDQQQNDQ